MTMLEYLELDKEKLLQELSGAGSPELAQKAMDAELDRLILQYNQACELPACRDAAADYVQIAKLTLPLANCQGETKVWQRHTAAEKQKPGKLSIFLLVCSILCLLGAVIRLIVASRAGMDADKIIDILVLMVLSPALAWISGRFSLKKGDAGETEYLTQTPIDSEKAWRILKNTVFAMDRSLENVEAAQLTDQKQQTEAAVSAMALPKDELELMAGLLEAACTEDGDYALDRLGEIRFYLHRQGIEALNYDGSNGAMFDFMPSKTAGTLRPALVSEGKLLKKGLASEGR